MMRQEAALLKKRLFLQGRKIDARLGNAIELTASCHLKRAATKRLLKMAVHRHVAARPAASWNDESPRGWPSRDSLESCM